MEEQPSVAPSQKPVPTGVKIISVLYYIGSIFGIIFGVLFLVGAKTIEGAEIPILGFFGAELFILGGVTLIISSIIGFFIGRGLWKGQNWARVVAIIFAILGILFIVVAMAQGQTPDGNIVTLIIDVVIAGYLLFSKNVKLAFSKDRQKAEDFLS